MVMRPAPRRTFSVPRTRRRPHDRQRARDYDSVRLSCGAMLADNGVLSAHGFSHCTTYYLLETRFARRRTAQRQRLALTPFAQDVGPLPSAADLRSTSALAFSHRPAGGGGQSSLPRTAPLLS